jgi:hypothetical protein
MTLGGPPSTVVVVPGPWTLTTMAARPSPSRGRTGRRFTPLD